MGGFELLDHTSEVGVSATGRDLKEAFAQAAQGMFSIIVESEDVGEVLEREVQAEAPDIGALLVAWLNELLYYFDAENMLFARFEVSELGETRLEARAYGEKVDGSRHRLKTGIKAATYHMLEVESGNGARVQVLFDV